MWGRIVLGVALALTGCASEVTDEHRAPAPVSTGDSTGNDTGSGYGGSICDGAGTNVLINGVEYRMPVFCRDDYVYMGDPPPKTRLEPTLPSILPAAR